MSVNPVYVGINQLFSLRRENVFPFARPFCPTDLGLKFRGFFVAKMTTLNEINHLAF